MVEWLKGEIGGLVIAVLGYILREFSENHERPEKIWESRGARFLVRFLAALVAGVIVLAMLPTDVPNYMRVGALAFAGAATPEIVRLMLARGLKRLDKATKDESNGR